MKNTYVLIMAGGSGTRFWPFSRNEKPKQFLDVLGTGQSLLQMTFDRFANIVDRKNIWIASSQQYKSLIHEQLPGIDDDQLLLEPFQRNTAPCIAYASHKIAMSHPEATMIVSPSDHAIFKEKEYFKVIKRAVKVASSDERLVTIGVKPNRPETGYGYIQYLEGRERFVKKVKTFTEKPELGLAKKFLESGDFVWNAGIFIWSVGSILGALQKHLPEIDEMFMTARKSYFTDKEEKDVEKAYSQCRNLSIDFGIMEKAKNVSVILGNFGWSDLGSWDVLPDLHKRDKDGNVILGNAVLYNSSNCIVKGDKEKLIVLNGLEDCLVADVDNALLISKAYADRSLKSIVNDLKSGKTKKYL